VMENKPIKLLPLKAFLPPYSSPPREPPPLRPELQESPRYSPARVVPPALLRPSPRKNGFNMRNTGFVGTPAYSAPEVSQASGRLTLNEINRVRAQSARSKLIFDPDFIEEWERGNPMAHQRLANLGRAAAGEKPLEPLPFPPLPPVKLKRFKLITLNNEEEPVTAQVASVPPPVAKPPPPAPKKEGKRARSNFTPNNKNTRKRKTRRLKNRRHK